MGFVVTLNFSFCRSVVPTKSDSDVTLCLQLLSKILTALLVA